MKFWKDKAFLKSMMAIAVPIALQNLVSSSLNMVDTLMISSLGKASISAVGLANQVFFFYILISFGINSGSSIFISQYWGREDVKSIRKVLGLALSISAFAGVIFTIIGFFFPEFVMKIFIQDPEVVKLGADYLKIVSLSYLITAISFAYSVALRSTGRPGVPLQVSIISFLVNTFFNYILIFGKLGIAPMGVKGAALGTLIARIVEIVFILYSVYKNPGPLSATLKELLDWDKIFVARYLKTTYPVIVNEAFWSLGQIMYSIAYARIGVEATAAVQIVTTIQNIFFVIVRGLANASTVMIGNKIGAGEKEESYNYAIMFLSMATLSGLFLGLTMALTPGVSLSLFRDLDPEVYFVARKMLVIMGLIFAIKTFNATVVVGVLRGGGDTTYSMYLEMGAVWLVGVPLAFIGALVFKLPVYWVMALISLEEIVKTVIAIPRVLSKKWIKDLT
jgi:putative MATE family efflux protein